MLRGPTGSTAGQNNDKRTLILDVGHLLFKVGVSGRPVPRSMGPWRVMMSPESASPTSVSESLCESLGLKGSEGQQREEEVRRFVAYYRVPGRSILNVTAVASPIDE